MAFAGSRLALVATEAFFRHIAHSLASQQPPRNRPLHIRPNRHRRLTSTVTVDATDFLNSLNKLSCTKPEPV